VESCYPTSTNGQSSSSPLPAVSLHRNRWISQCDSSYRRPQCARRSNLIQTASQAVSILDFLRVAAQPQRGRKCVTAQHIVYSSIPMTRPRSYHQAVCYPLRIAQPHSSQTISRPYMEFFASRSAAMTSTRSVFPVNFWIAGSYKQLVISSSL
jgi:hypothetical protein